MRLPLPCLVCGKELEDVLPVILGSNEDAGSEGRWAEHGNQPNDATAFSTHGHYGSGVFDPGPPSTDRLEINVCDDCLNGAAARGRVALVKTEHVIPTITYTPFE